ncbi:helix-turn-helix domain-containing protein [Vagococcus xieshaowenii]|uniref:helix-turn-helix domain-containing protein n=1 Tax=Vagococcus xieshaowenii TaxID=2562451 RepID=UPI001F51842F|nr:helix-turn-helix domain-containing protein [Vagococcus xieshaowenii]
MNNGIAISTIAKERGVTRQTIYRIKNENYFIIILIVLIEKKRNEKSPLQGLLNFTKIGSIIFTIYFCY